MPAGRARQSTLGIRPEHLTLGEGTFNLTLTPAIIEHLGIHTLTHCKLASGGDFVALFEGEPEVSENIQFKVGIDPARCHLFDSGGLAVARAAWRRPCLISSDFCGSKRKISAAPSGS